MMIIQWKTNESHKTDWKKEKGNIHLWVTSCAFVVSLTFVNVSVAAGLFSVQNHEWNDSWWGHWQVTVFPACLSKHADFMNVKERKEEKGRKYSIQLILEGFYLFC